MSLIPVQNLGIPMPDTGWVDIPLSDDWELNPVEGRARMRRIGPMVWAEVRIRRIADQTSTPTRLSVTGSLPVAFRPSLFGVYSPAGHGITPNFVVLVASSQNLFDVYAPDGIPTDAAVQATWSYIARNE